MKSHVRSLVAVLLFTFISFHGFSQQKDTLIHSLDSFKRKTDSIGSQINNIAPQGYNETTKITFKNYFILLGSDLRQEFTKPFHMTRKNWGQFGKFAAVAIALGLADEPIQKFAVKVTRNNPGFQKVSNFISRFGGSYETYGLIGLGAYAFISKDEKIKVTVLLASQAYITGFALEKVLKFLTGRTRPSFYAPNMEAEPKFLGPFSPPKNINDKIVQASFPSGHATVAFAAATIFAKEYKNKPIVPIIAYTSATLISLSRITENKHWATDVLAGAVIGYLAGQNIVNNYHRYAKIKASAKKQNTISFNLEYANGGLQPGLLYKFR